MAYLKLELVLDAVKDDTFVNFIHKPDIVEMFWRFCFVLSGIVLGIVCMDEEAELRKCI